MGGATEVELTRDSDCRVTASLAYEFGSVRELETRFKIEPINSSEFVNIIQCQTLRRRLILLIGKNQ